MTKSEIVAAKLNKLLESNELLLCNYSKQFVIRKRSVLAVDGNCLRVNGKGNSFIIGTFKAYVN